jgi:integrase/recombinase XerD
MSKATSLGTWIRRFLLEYLVQERNLSPHTRHSYRDALVLLLPFASTHLHRPVDKLIVTDLSADLVRRFLQHLETERHCSIVTRNQRLAAIHCLARYIGDHSPEHIEWCSHIRLIPLKRTMRASIGNLDKPQLDALLSAPDRNTSQGQRDYSLLLFLYNSGARADEVARLRIGDIFLDAASVRIFGKGRRTRHCPLWPRTIEALRTSIGRRGSDEPVFLNRRNQPYTRFGIHALVERHATAVRSQFPDLAGKRISPHIIRHTTACHLLRAGVDINTIRGWLGHVSVETTNVYAEVDLEMKAKALARCDIGGDTHDVGWRTPALLEFLRAL